MLYLDANFFIFALFDIMKKGQNARSLQKEIIDGKKTAVTSVLALEEVMWVIIKNKKKALIRQVIQDIYAMPNLSIKEVSPIVPVKALDFMEKYNLKPRDSFHLAVMELLNVTLIVSDDVDFDKVKSIKRIKLE
ncbi:type II toxin-antitoxin system VapC family toxin [Candidatus Woesearchaeota archaeon]|nr:type II toxin-antitoxin system VapC family toxin [Candidatus Woesearchaeota archaeon]